MKDEEIIIIKQGNKTTATTWEKAKYPHFLLEALTSSCQGAVSGDLSRTVLRKVAWALGEAGFPDECAAIAEAAKDPEPTPTLGMYGWFSI